MTIDVRPTAPSELHAAATAVSNALMFGRPDDASFERRRQSWLDMDSTWSAWDGGACVGHGGQFVVDTTVPGGARLATGAVTRVGVVPTHRRRGIATRLMAGLVADSAERGWPLMSLRASEAVIYRRYGFGVAGDSASIRVDPRRVRPLAGPDVGGTVAIVPHIDVLDVVPPLYERVASRRVGAISRPRAWWAQYLRAVVEPSEGSSCVVVHRDGDGEPDGYVHYTTEWQEGGVNVAGRGELHDLFGADDGVELALWRYIVDIDLVATWFAERRPVDDLIRHAARDPRGVSTEAVVDEQWVRVIDVDAALRARTYGSAARDLVITIDDPVLPANRGTWIIGEHGAARADGAASDLVVPIDALGEAYLGGRSWRTLAAAGRVEVADADADALAVADARFATHPAPFSGSFF